MNLYFVRKKKDLFPPKLKLTQNILLSLWLCLSSEFSLLNVWFWHNTSPDMENYTCMTKHQMDVLISYAFQIVSCLKKQSVGLQY